MRTIHTEIGILAPAAVVWEVLTDFEGWQRWNPFMRVTGEAKPDAPLSLVISVPKRKPVKLRPRIIHFEAGRELRWLGRGMAVPGLFDGEHGFRVVAEDTGRCRFEQFETFKGLLASAVLSRTEGAIKTGFTAMNRSLKREAERLARERA